jgi:predicted RNA-binding Zn ribbon-like protein
VPRYDLPKAAPQPLELLRRFVNTVDLVHGREWLSSPAALDEWCAEHGLRVEAELTEQDLRRALDVREALRSLARANNRSGVQADAISTLNHGLRAARVEIGLGADGTPHAESYAGGLDGALGRLLAILLDAMQDGTWRRLKACPECGWLFYDCSRNRSATWCSMAICGNRLKTRAYRKRKGGAHVG